MQVRRAVAALAALVGASCARPVDPSWHEESGYRWRQLDVPRRGHAGFTALTAGATGITHTNTVSDEHALANRHLLLGAGAAAADVDADGRVDLFLASVESPGALYHNEGGMRFRDVTKTSGIDLAKRGSTGVAFADVDGDGDPDLLLGTIGGPVCLFQNDGRGHFRDVTATSGLDSGFAATTMALADIDGDSDLDLYVATYKVRNALDAFTPQARSFDQVVKKVEGKFQVVPEWAKEYRIEDRPDLGGIVRFQRAERDLFYLNDGAGHFTAQPTTGARWLNEDGVPLTDTPDYFTLAAQFHDVNGDGAPDLYVCNDFEDPDQFWLNDGRGNFRMVPRVAVRATSNTCMSVSFADVNRDGAVDFFTADMLSPTRAARQRQIPTHTPLPKTVGASEDRAQWMRNMLQISRGDGTWQQIADFAGVAATDWTWGSAFVDVDLDGYEDLLVAAGHRWDVRDADTYDRIRNAFPRVAWNREQGEFPRLKAPNVALRNNRDLTFTDVAREWGFGRDSAISQGIALADLDGDGDIDPVVTRLDDPPVVYRNESNAHRVAVRLVGRAPNTGAVGAQITVRAPTLPAQTREVAAGGSYLSGNDGLQVFATGADSLVRIEVRWRDGSHSHVDGARPNRLYEIDESRIAPDADTPRGAAPPAPLFADVTPTLAGHAHSEPVFDDFRRQPLLPNRFSQLGPGVAWVDVDRDGREDLVVGSGRGGRLAILRNTPNGFVRTEGAAVDGDLGAVLPVPGPDGVRLLASQSSYEADSLTAALRIPSVIGYDVRGGRPMNAAAIVAGDTAALGALALGDVDGDGCPDLFAAARIVPGLWPLPARSHLFRGSANGTFSLDASHDDALKALGLVTAATFADVNGDARPDLIVASEWGPVRVLLNENGHLQDATAKLGMSTISSRWFGVTAGDFDGDGRLDLIATSWGRNVPWHASAAHPYTMWVARSPSGLVPLPAEFDPASNNEMPVESFSRLTVALPRLRERIGSYAEYARSDVSTVLGDLATGAVRVGATTFDQTLFLNRGDHFEARPLPALAQLAPAVAPVVADFDGNGTEDLFLSQNFFPTEISTLRFDAGAGIVLLGDGRGGFVPQTVQQSGIAVLGDQRGSATADFDGDGRPDLAVSQNGGLTRLFRNQTARPGLRVKLDGGPLNPLGVGAQLRVRTGGKWGPTREVRAGTGYWSTDGATTVLAVTEQSDSLSVRWPGATSVQVEPIVAGARELRVTRR